MINILLLDPQPLVRRGLRDLLGAEPGLAITGEAGRWSELQPLLAAGGADVLLMDLELPDRPGLDLIAALRPSAAAPACLVLSAGAEDPAALRAFDAGAFGYLHKDHHTAQLAAAIRCVASRRRYLTPSVASLLAPRPAPATARGLHDRLSAAERRILSLLAQGRRVPEIADALELPPRSISIQRARILEKLCLGSLAQLQHYAQAHALA